MKIRGKVMALDVASAVNQMAPNTPLMTATFMKTMLPDQHDLGLGRPEPSIAEFRQMAARVKSLSSYEDLMATQGVTKEILSTLGSAVPIDSLAEAQLVAKIATLLSGCSPKERELVYHELDLMQEIADLRERMTGADKDAKEARAHFDSILPEFQEKWREVVRRSKVVPLPPTTSTANNLEALMMANAFVIEPVTSFSRVPEDYQDSAREAALTMVKHLADKTPSVQRVVQKLNLVFAKHDLSDDAVAATQTFSVAWMRSGFAKLEIGHKLAASLALTDVPDDIEVQAPWAAWSLVVPPDLFGDEGVARVWCEGTEARFMVGSDGRIIGPVTREMMLIKTTEPEGQAVAVAIDSLVRGCCLALSNPDDYKKHKSSASSPKPKHPRSSGAPDFGQARFLLSAPITIDMRQHLRAALSGKKHSGGAQAVQFLVRGHWRNQAHGSRLSLRKTIRIQPFWKGNEDARVLLRNYKVKEDK